jgi:hypothetical protein
MREGSCEERIRLSNAVSMASLKSSEEKMAFDKATRKNQGNLSLLWGRLMEARLAERSALVALDSHIREHEC